MKQKELSLWLRAIVILGAVCVLALGVGITAHLWLDAGAWAGEVQPARWVAIPLWISAIPVAWFLALVWQMAGEIGRDNSFCMENARRLKTCAALALADTVLYAVAGPVLTLTGQLPGRTLAAVVLIVAVGLAMAVCCAALSHLTRKAAELKQENDLTI